MFISTRCYATRLSRVRGAAVHLLRKVKPTLVCGETTIRADTLGINHKSGRRLTHKLLRKAQRPARISMQRKEALERHRNVDCFRCTRQLRLTREQYTTCSDDGKPNNGPQNLMIRRDYAPTHADRGHSMYILQYVFARLEVATI